MRLSTRLSDKNKNFGKIESFIDWGKYTISPEEESEELQLISDGDFIEIQIGKISLPFYSTQCNDCVNFDSPLKLHCLIVNKSMVSIDCELHCTAYDKNNSLCKNCNHCVQAWFLVEADDIFASSPEINVIKQNFKLPQNIKLPIENEDKFILEDFDDDEVIYDDNCQLIAIKRLKALQTFKEAIDILNNMFYNKNIKDLEKLVIDNQRR